MEHPTNVDVQDVSIYRVLHDPVRLKAICGLLSQILTDETKFAVNTPELIP